ncbi:flavodoxin domain-containing protein [Alkalibacter mobilis]|uniref:flavodoxin domain-containing protein n=1 Tax=Alkalibacter mobilis TaxID=2787712 RepID=UPI00189DEE49|nr:flavodoxin domain-containing protein [Alkalibacter mobilis]MBF7096452.1 flavodoxin [Alkalibacter mobilis]
MSDIAVVYQSKYGSTEKYAKWLSEELNTDLLKRKDIKINDLIPYDTLVYCGGLYAGGILGFSLIKRNFERLKQKRIIVVAVGATLKKDTAKEELKKQNLAPEMLDKVEFHLLRGGLNYKKMNPLDRFLMYLSVKSIKSKNPEDLDDDSKGMLATYGKVVDFTNKKHIMPIVESLI